MTTTTAGAAKDALDHPAIAADGLILIGRRRVRPLTQDRRDAILSALESDGPRIERRRGGARWAAYRRTRSGMHAAWCLETCRVNGWTPSGKLRALADRWNEPAIGADDTGTSP